MQTRLAHPILHGVSATRRIVVIGFENVQALDVTGPLEVFSVVNRLVQLDPPAYRLEFVGPTRKPIATSSGLSLVPHGPIVGVRGAVDTLLVAGGLGARAAAADLALLQGLRRVARGARRVASVCTGAFLLAEAGLLKRKRATTHWAQCAALQRNYPDVLVERDPIFVRDGHIWTSAGVTAGMDLALAMVEEDLGAQMARDVARWLVLFLQRPGGQAQFSAQLQFQLADRRPIQELQAWIPDHLHENLSVSALASRVAMSVRHFARSFAHQVGVTPAKFVDAARVEAAQRALCSSVHSIDLIARRCGFNTIETLERAFRRTLRVSPQYYRRHFQPFGHRQEKSA